MTFTPTKPDPGPSPALDAPTIQANFAQFLTAFTANHTTLNNSHRGDHEKVIIQSQLTDPEVTQDLVVLYAKPAVSQVSTEPQLFLRIPKFLPNEQENTPMQITYSTVNISGPQYQSFLPGGYVLYWGQTTNVAIQISLSPQPSKIISVIATPYTAFGAGPNLNIPYPVQARIDNNFQFSILAPGISGVYAYGYFVLAKA